LYAYAKYKISTFVKDERGDFGIGQIVAIVAAIIIIGVIVSIVTGAMGEWVSYLWEQITGLFDSFGAKDGGVDGG